MKSTVVYVKMCLGFAAAVLPSTSKEVRVEKCVKVLPLWVLRFQQAVLQA